MLFNFQGPFAVLTAGLYYIIPFRVCQHFFQNFFEPVGSNLCFVFSVPLSRDSLDIIPHCLAFVNTFLKTFFRPPGPTAVFFCRVVSRETA